LEREVIYEESSIETLAKLGIIETDSAGTVCKIGTLSQFSRCDRFAEQSG